MMKYFMKSTIPFPFAVSLSHGQTGINRASFALQNFKWCITETMHNIGGQS